MGVGKDYATHFDSLLKGYHMLSHSLVVLPVIQPNSCWVVVILSTRKEAIYVR